MRFEKDHYPWMIDLHLFTVKIKPYCKVSECCSCWILRNSYSNILFHTVCWDPCYHTKVQQCSPCLLHNSRQTSNHWDYKSTVSHLICRFMQHLLPLCIRNLSTWPLLRNLWPIHLKHSRRPVVPCKAPCFHVCCTESDCLWHRKFHHFSFPLLHNS